MTGETVGDPPPLRTAASTCAASAGPAGAGRASTRSVPTRSAAWSSCERCHVVRTAVPRTAAATAAATSTIAVPAWGRAAACRVASGQVREGERAPAAAARPRRNGTSCTPRTVSAATHSTGASVRVTSAESVALADCDRSCQDAATAATSSSSPVPALARTRPRPAGCSAPEAVVVPMLADTSAALRATAASRTAATSPDVTCGSCCSPALARSGRCVRRACSSALAGIATSAATIDRSTASVPTAVTCWRRLSPMARRSSRSSARIDETSRPASRAAARARAVPSTRTTRTVARVLACWAWTVVSVRGRSEASRVIRARSPTCASSRPDAASREPAASRSLASLARSTCGYPVTRRPRTEEPVARKAVRSTTKGP